jgi:hypothetical protein
MKLTITIVSNKITKPTFGIKGAEEKIEELKSQNVAKETLVFICREICFKSGQIF